MQQAGYREIEHTADWQLEVWGPDLPTLLEQAARGMYTLSGIRLAEGPPEERQLELGCRDREDCLVSFLSELLYFAEQEGLAFDRFELEVLPEEKLHAHLFGGAMTGPDKEIKAVTYHNLSVREGAMGLEARVVFDV